ncbi:hypothetical protein CHU98_g2774 [Xylaria longipes]|nr:hypothetical protein CHU98_g2774 [Xylaria longipes]
MANTKRKPRQRRSVARRTRKNLHLRVRGTATTAPSAPANSTLADPGARASSALASRASDGISEAVQEESLPHRSVEEGPRLIRIRVCSPRKLLYSADDPTGVLVANTSRTPIWLGGALSDYDSNVVLSSPRDLVYFDKIPPFIHLDLLGALDTSASDPSSMALIALNLSKIPRASFMSLFCAIDNEALSGLLLVVTNDSIRDLVRDTTSNEWGFREVSEGALHARQPDLYAKGRELVDTFNNHMEEEQTLDYTFVFDWDRLGEE